MGYFGIWMEGEIVRDISGERSSIYFVQCPHLHSVRLHIWARKKSKLLQLIMQGKIQVKRCIRRSMSWLLNLIEWFGCRSGHMFRAATSKIRIALTISNFPSGGTRRRKMLQFGIFKDVTLLPKRIVYLKDIESDELCGEGLVRLG